MATAQSAFRFYEDGPPASASPLAAQDADIVITDGRIFHVRLQIQDDGPGESWSKGITVQYQKNGGTWLGVPAHTATNASIKCAQTAHFTGQTPVTTERLTGGTGAFNAGYRMETTALCWPSDFTLAGGEHSECLLSIQIVPADASAGDTFDIRAFAPGTGTPARVTYQPAAGAGRRIFVV